MRPTTLTLLLCSLAFALACVARDGGTQTAQTAATPAANASEQTSNASAASSVVPVSPTCALLSRADVESVQGEAFADAQGSEHFGDGLIRSQCFYRLPTFSKSLNLEVARLDPNANTPDALKQFWRQKFDPEAVEKRERERREKLEREQERELERERASGQLSEGGHTEEKEREDEEEEGRTRRVAGLGDAAFWTGGERGGSLYVLLKDAIIRVSVSGEDSEPTRIKKATALARKVLTHF